MKINSQVIHKFHHSELKEISSLEISNSIIYDLDFVAFDSSIEVVISNSIIHNLNIHSCWFRQGLVLENSHIINYIDYQMGGHNDKPIVLSGNIFHSFFNFFDCSFGSVLVIERNIFTKGSNLIGNLEEGFRNIFDEEPQINENIGPLYLDGVGEI